MTAIVEEGRIVGYRYSILELEDGEYVWWAERPNGTACWRGNIFPVPTSVEEAKQQITETLEKYGVSVPSGQ